MTISNFPKLFLLAMSCISSIVLCSTAANANQSGAPAAKPLDYFLSVQLAPEKQSVSVTATLRNVRCDGKQLDFYLNRAFEIESVDIDGSRADFQYDPTDAKKYWASAGRAIRIACPREDVRIVYKGTGALTKDGRNQVTPELIELSAYSVWYPALPQQTIFVWALTTTLPINFVYASNADSTVSEKSGTQNTIRLARTNPANDIAIVSSEFFKANLLVDLTKRTEILFIASKDLPSETNDKLSALQREAAESMRSFGVLTGTQKASAVPTIVFSRRGGPLAYARHPLIIIPQTQLLEAEDADRTVIFNLRHELGHFWWNKPNAEASADWINEGLAEHFAALRTREAEGVSAYENVLVRYRALVSKEMPRKPIMSSLPNVQLSFVNLYIKPILLFDQIERRFGRNKHQRLVRAIYNMDTTNGQRSEDVIEAARRMVGQDVAALIAMCLRREDWPATCGGSD